jgi:hypothetical protein
MPLIMFVSSSFNTYVNLPKKKKMNIYHKLKVSYGIKLVIIKHVLVKELLILKVQNDDIKP